MTASPAPSEALQSMLRTRHLWRAGEKSTIATVSSGFKALDERLPGGGWPIGSLVELVAAGAGIGELSLPLPALKALARAGKPIAFVRPPYLPYAPALRRAGLPLKQIWWIDAQDLEARWAAEQMLRGGAGAVLLWTDAKDSNSLRRLQLSAESTQSLAFVYRPASCLSQTSPAAVRAQLRPTPLGMQVELLKVRGAFPTRVSIDLPRAGIAV